MSMNTAAFIAAQASGKDKNGHMQVVVPKVEGIPGEAKTSVMKSFAKALGCDLYVVIGSIRDPADIAGYPFPRENGSKFVELIPPRYVHDIVTHAANGGRHILFWDELTTCNPATQSAMLRPMAEGVIGDVELPENVIQIAACNPPGCAANGFELEAAMANRLVHLKWEMDWDAWDQGMLSGGAFPEPSFPILPQDWDKHLVGVQSMLVAFRHRKPHLFRPKVDANGHMDVDRAVMGGPWPSARSITSGARCMAAAQSVGAGESIEVELLEGAAGHEFAMQFFEWRRNLDLPDPKDVLNEFVAARKGKRDPIWTAPDRPDKLMAQIAGVTNEIIGHSGDKVEDDRWHAGCDLIEIASRESADIALSCCKPLFDAMPKGVQPTDEFVEKVWPTLYKCVHRK